MGGIQNPYDSTKLDYMGLAGLGMTLLMKIIANIFPVSSWNINLYPDF